MSTGRNELCPCGSGKKYKKCCGLKASVKVERPTEITVSASVARELSTLGQLLQVRARQPFESGIERLLSHHPDCAPAWNLMGVAQQMFGGDGIPAFRRAAELLPDRPEAQKNLGLALFDAGKFESAAQAFERCIELGAQDPATLNTLGAALLGCSRPAAAEQWLERAIAQDTKYRPARVNLCRSLRYQGKSEAAVEQAHVALQLLSPSADLWQELGECLRGHGDVQEAVRAFEEAVRLAPSDMAMLNNLAVVHTELANWGRADELFTQLSSRSDCSYEVFENLARIHEARGDHAGALSCLRTATERFPGNAQAHEQLGLAHYSRADVRSALGCMRRAMTLMPESSRLFSNYLFFLLHDPEAPVSEVLEAHWTYGRRWGSNLVPEEHAVCPGQADKILRVGFVSADFRAHAMMSFFEPLLHELARFDDLELVAFYTHAACDSVSERARASFHTWHQVDSLSDAELAKRIRDERIDILVDMSGHTGGNRLPVFGRKPAPLQMSCWGYPATTGLPQMDYFLADVHWPPPGRCDDQFSEKLCYLRSNAVFRPTMPSPDVSDLPALKNGYLTLGSFNRPRKLSGKVFGHWGKILRALPDARLIVGGLDEGDTGQWLVEALQREGVEAKRLHVYPRMGMQAYLAMHHDVDFCLNGFPYTGGTTICHAAWMGVPTLTLSGELAVTLTGPSILRRLGLEGWVVESEDALVQKAVDVAGDLQGLARLRASLRQRLLDSDLGVGRAAEVAHDIRRALREMWTRYCKGLPPQTIDLSGPTEGLSMHGPVGVTSGRAAENTTNPADASHE